jgi:hypothetical protein
MSPRYPHDCKACRFLGRIDYVDPWSGMQIEADLYHCPPHEVASGGSVLARVGPEDFEYASAPLNIAEHYEPPFSTTGLALYVAAVAVISKARTEKEKARREKETP